MNTEERSQDHHLSSTSTGNGTFSFLFNTSVPAGVRVLVVANTLLTFYFLITFAVLAVFVAVEPERAQTTLMAVLGYHLLSGIVLGMSVFPLWYGRAWAVKVSLLGSILLVGYSAVWFLLGSLFSFFAFFFLLVGALGGLYISTGREARRYYTKTFTGRFLG